MSVDNDMSELMWDKKYAPASVDDMILDSELRSAVSGWIKKQALPQNLLFCGIQGTGKTTLADILIRSIDCEALRLTAQSGKNGVDFISSEIGSFVSLYSFRPFKVVLFDEIDRIGSLQAQKAILSLMDEHKDSVRFIFTANHINKLEDALVSRCVNFSFKVLDKKQVGKFVCQILDKEKIKYDNFMVKKYLDQFYPDVRGIINHIQYHSIGGTLKAYSDSLDIEKEVFELLRQRNVTELSKKLYAVEFPKLYRYMFDHIDELCETEEDRQKGSITVAAYLARDSYIADREVNFRACCIALLSKILVVN